MFNRSKKYIFLLVINILAVVIFYMSSNASRDYPFDTEFVYGLMQQEKALLNEKQQLEFELSTTNDLLAGVQTQVLQSQDLILASEAKYRRCESDKQLLQNQQSFTQTQASQCGFEKASLTATQDKLKQVNQQLNKLENDYNQTVKFRFTAIASAQVVLTKRYGGVNGFF